jgi:glycosyltransferase involved in cell wall biosynthesis
VIGGGRLAPPDDPRALAGAIAEAAASRLSLSRAARAHIEAQHSLNAAAGTLKSSLSELLR